MKDHHVRYLAFALIVATLIAVGVHHAQARAVPKAVVVAPSYTPTPSPVVTPAPVTPAPTPTPKALPVVTPAPSPSSKPVVR